MCNINPLCNYFQVNISQSQQAKSPTNYWIISLSDALSVRNLKTVPDSVLHSQQAQCWWAVSCRQKAKLNLLKCIHPKYGGWGVEECRHKFHPVQIVILGSGSSPLGWIPARHGTAQQCCWAHPLMQNWTSQWTTLPRQQSPQRKPPTDVNTDDLECWWSELKLYTRSFLHEWSLAREGEDGRAGGGGAVRWRCVKSGDSLRWSPAGQRPCRDTRQQRDADSPWKCGGKLMKPEDHCSSSNQIGPESVVEREPWVQL